MWGRVLSSVVREPEGEGSLKPTASPTDRRASDQALGPTTQIGPNTRFRGDVNTTEGLLLADYLKSIVTARNLPADLAAQAAGSRFLAQYCPGAPRWVCRPADLPDTDLTFAFESG